MATQAQPHWLLISILFSSLPMSEELARSLYEAAWGLYSCDESSTRLGGDPAHGEVRNLRKSFTLGAIVGPGFEADLDTLEGAGRVLFLLTHRGIEARARTTPAN